MQTARQGGANTGHRQSVELSVRQKAWRELWDYIVLECARRSAMRQQNEQQSSLEDTK